MEVINILDDADIPALNTDYWICQGRTYPKERTDIPPELEAYCNKITTIPLHHTTTLLPNSDLSVEKFLDLPLPAQCKSLINTNPHELFQNDFPTEHVSCLYTREIPSLDFVEKAELILGHRVSAQNPLRPASNDYDDQHGSGYRFILWDGQIWLAQVLSLYSKSAVKNGKHCWVSDSSKISAVSYIPTKLFEPLRKGARQFRLVPSSLTSLGISRYALLPATSFLCTLETAPHLLGNSLMISTTDNTAFTALRDRVQNIAFAVKEINRKPRRKHQTGKTGDNGCDIDEDD